MRGRLLGIEQFSEVKTVSRCLLSNIPADDARASAPEKGKLVPRRTPASHGAAQFMLSTTQTTGETRKRLHRRSIKAAHEYWINTRSISSFSWHGGEGRLCCDGGGAARVFPTHFLHGSPS